DLIAERGGTVRTLTSVRRVLREGRRATGVELEDGTRVECPAVVANCAPHDLFEHLLAGGEGRAPRYEPLAGSTSISAMVVHLCVEQAVEVPAQVTLVQETTDPDEAFTA